MSTWEYRAVRIPSPHGDTIKLAEVHYEETGGDPPRTITSWCFASGPQGDSREDLQAELRHMTEAANAGIISAATLPGYAVEGTT